MRPGQLEPNELEVELLRRFGVQDPSLCVDSLHVLSRKFTGVGSFTEFLSGETKWDRVLHLDGIISMPGVPSGLAALLFCTGRQPNLLEIVSFGDEHWDGVYEGFAIRKTI